MHPVFPWWVRRPRNCANNRLSPLASTTFWEFVFAFVFCVFKTANSKRKSLCFFQFVCFHDFVFRVLCLHFQSTLYSYALKSQTQTTWFVFWGQDKKAKFVFVFCICLFEKANPNTKSKTQNTKFANWGHWSVSPKCKVSSLCFVLCVLEKAK